MADDNRPWKYARYAIGEIVLVVIGILIALQINTWKEEQKAKRVEFVMLTELKKNIEADIQEMDSTLISVNHRIRSSKIILKSFSNDNSYHDSLNSHFGWTMVYDNMYFHTGAYESLKSSGSQLINDESLRFEISNYYDYSINRLKYSLREIRDDFYNYMLGYLRKEFTFFTNSGPTAHPRDFEALKENETFGLSLGIYLDVQVQLRDNLKRTLKPSRELLEKIDARIERIDS
ncbi:DUF6090 family protein [Lutimonas vermicola]|uniref:DUF6090 family protein n=1 Tax=Lutimonas vermicola TaxID=414288 RepID=A0ABU9KZS8_9FLAO